MKKLLLFFIIAFGLTNINVKAQNQPFVGQIAYVAFNFAPKGWAECNGQILPISQNTALFSLLGTYYGGDGKTTFALPDMRGRLLVNSGSGPGLSNYDQGQTGGQESETLSIGEMPSHSHDVKGVIAEGNNAAATNNLPANTKALDKEYSTLPADTMMNPSMVSATGGSQPHENRSPYLALKCIIAFQGIFPSRP